MCFNAEPQGAQSLIADVKTRRPPRRRESTVLIDIDHLALVDDSIHYDPSGKQISSGAGFDSPSRLPEAKTCPFVPSVVAAKEFGLRRQLALEKTRAHSGNGGTLPGRNRR